MTNPINKLKSENFIKIALVAVFILLIFNFSSKVSAVGSVNKIYDLSNILREKEGLLSLSVDGNLEKAANLRAQDMFQKQYFDHFSANGLSPWDAIKITGFDYSFAGENLAIGYQSDVNAFNAWVSSPSHYQNIIDPNFNKIGVAEVSGMMHGKNKTVIVQLFATEKTQINGIVGLVDENYVKNVVDWIKSIF